MTASAPRSSASAARLEDIQQAIHDLAHHHRATASAALGGSDQRCDQRPLGIRQVARVAQLIAPVTVPIGRRPRRKDSHRFEQGSCSKALKSKEMFVDGLSGFSEAGISRSKLKECSWTGTEGTK